VKRPFSFFRFDKDKRETENLPDAVSSGLYEKIGLWRRVSEAVTAC